MEQNVEHPLVSIIILNYNAGKLLEDCINSIFQSNYKNYEIIVVDNDSKDNSPNPGDVNSIQFDLNDQQLSPLKTVGGSIVTMTSDFDRAGLVMYRESLDDLLVFSRSCSHAGTSINAFSNGVATCPNHGAKFNIDGSAISGPTNAPLLQYSSTIDGSIVTITK